MNTTTERCVEDLRQRLAEIRKALEEIIETDGVDKGVILVSSESPTKWNEHLKAHVYEYEYFSPLGDALIKLWELTEQ